MRFGKENIIIEGFRIERVRMKFVICPSSSSNSSCASSVANFILSEDALMHERPSLCIPCKPHAGGTPGASQVYAKVEGWRTPEVQTSKEPCVETCILLRLYAKVYKLGYIYAATSTGKLTPFFRIVVLEITHINSY